MAAAMMASTGERETQICTIISMPKSYPKSARTSGFKLTWCPSHTSILSAVLAAGSVAAFSTPGPLGVPFHNPIALRGARPGRCPNTAGLRASLNDPVGKYSGMQQIETPKSTHDFAELAGWAEHASKSPSAHMKSNMTHPTCYLTAEGGADGSLEKILGNVGLGKVGKSIDWFFDTSTISGAKAWRLQEVPGEADAAQYRKGDELEEMLQVCWRLALMYTLMLQNTSMNLMWVHVQRPRHTP